jgi:indolepyruvate ferredoxin oxidoreductase alpha subunit
VLMRLCTRLSHSRADVRTSASKAAQNELQPPDAATRRFVLLPAIAKRNYEALCAKQDALVAGSEASPFNRYEDGADKSVGVVACGIAYNYLQEAFGGKCPHPVLKLSQYPLPKKQLARLMGECRSVVVLEDGMPFVEQMLRGPLGNDRILGRLSGDLPRTGELNPRLVAEAFKLELPPVPAPSPLVKIRPPRLCDGCPHINSYEALSEALKDFADAKVFGDIGCYTLGALPPYNAISSCVDMGASIAMAKGAADAGVFPAVGIIGDSTFTHSGMTGLLDAVWENSPITVIILDNSTTAMTGGQDSMGSGRMAEICAGIGVNREHIREFVPLPKNHAANVQIIREEMAYRGLSVIIARRECIQTLRRKKR